MANSISRNSSDDFWPPQSFFFKLNLLVCVYKLVNLKKTLDSSDYAHHAVRQPVCGYCLQWNNVSVTVNSFNPCYVESLWIFCFQICC